MACNSRFTHRTAKVDFDKTWLARPIDWSLRIVGQSIGCGYIDHSERRIPTARFARRADADRAAAIWIETGLTPAYQTDERIAAVRAEMAPAIGIAA